MGRTKTVADSEILAAARTIFLAGGPSASTREIADLVALSQATLFQRFGDKSSLYLAAMMPEAIDPRDIIGDPSDAVKKGAHQHIEDMALRLLKKLSTTIPLVLAISRQPGVDAAIIAAAHERLQISALIQTLKSHISTIGLSPKHAPEAVVEAILVAAHGAAFMSLASPAKHAHQSAATLRRVIETLLSE